MAPCGCWRTEVILQSCLPKSELYLLDDSELYMALRASDLEWAWKIIPFCWLGMCLANLNVRLDIKRGVTLQRRERCLEMQRRLSFFCALVALRSGYTGKWQHLASSNARMAVYLLLPSLYVYYALFIYGNHISEKQAPWIVCRRCDNKKSPDHPVTHH